MRLQKNYLDHNWELLLFLEAEKLSLFCFSKMSSIVMESSCLTKDITIFWTRVRVKGNRVQAKYFLPTEFIYSSAYWLVFHRETQLSFITWLAFPKNVIIMPLKDTANQNTPLYAGLYTMGYPVWHLHFLKPWSNGPASSRKWTQVELA